MKALACTREEVLLMVALLASAVVISLQQGVLTLDLHLWVIVLWIQSIPYGASLVASIISGFSTLPAGFIGKTLGKAMR
jgi:hypothetical protein